MTDPALLNEAQAAGYEIRPVTGEEIDRILGETYAIPAAVISHTAALMK